MYVHKIIYNYFHTLINQSTSEAVLNTYLIKLKPLKMCREVVKICIPYRKTRKIAQEPEETREDPTKSQTTKSEEISRF